MSVTLGLRGPTCSTHLASRQWVPRSPSDRQLQAPHSPSHSGAMVLEQLCSADSERMPGLVIHDCASDAMWIDNDGSGAKQCDFMQLASCLSGWMTSQAFSRCRLQSTFGGRCVYVDVLAHSAWWLLLPLKSRRSRQKEQLVLDIFDSASQHVPVTNIDWEVRSMQLPMPTHRGEQPIRKTSSATNLLSSTSVRSHGERSP